MILFHSPSIMPVCSTKPENIIPDCNVINRFYGEDEGEDEGGEDEGGEDGEDEGEGEGEGEGEEGEGEGEEGEGEGISSVTLPIFVS